MNAPTVTPGTAHRYAVTLTVEVSTDGPLTIDELDTWADAVQDAANEHGHVADMGKPRAVFIPTRYGVTTDYDYTAEHKRQRLEVWSGPWFHTFEGEAFSLPAGGFMVTTHDGERVRVSCPSPRDESNYLEVDAAISDALNAHEAARGSVRLASAVTR